MGAACTRPSLCPLNSRDDHFKHNSGMMCRENARTCGARSLNTTAVIPGRPQGEPGIHTHIRMCCACYSIRAPLTPVRDYGFRARSPCERPGMTRRERASHLGPSSRGAMRRRTGRGLQNNLLERPSNGEYRSPISPISKIAPAGAIRQTMRPQLAPGVSI